jgi:hypothetical protein
MFFANLGRELRRSARQAARSESAAGLAGVISAADLASDPHGRRPC